MDKKIYYYLLKVEDLIAKKPVMPVTVEIDPSNRCQLDCSYCMFKSIRQEIKDKRTVISQTDLPIDTYRHLLMDLKSIGVQSITFTGGGEPTMNKHFNEMVDLTQQLRFEFGLITNGLLLHRVRRLDRFKFIRVSLDAGTSGTYRKLKGVDAFQTVLRNISAAKCRKAMIGLSYVVNKLNRDEIPIAQEIAERLGVTYIQFKPAWIDGKPFTDYFIANESRETIRTDRYQATDMVPCAIAGLIGIVGADSHVYYCCQYRGNRRYGLGSLNTATFPEIWKRRPHMIPDIGRCPNCRYMNYTRAYKKLLKNSNLFVKHRKFL